MTRAIAMTALAAIALTACSGGGSSAATDTRMRNVDILDGTASDEMILLDQASGETTAIDPSTDSGPAAPRPAPSANGDTAGGAAPGTGAAGNTDAPVSNEAAADRPSAGTTANAGDVVIRPPAPRERPQAERAPTERQSQERPRSERARPARDSADAPATKR